MRLHFISAPTRSGRPSQSAVRARALRCIVFCASKNECPSGVGPTVVTLRVGLKDAVEEGVGSDLE